MFYICRSIHPASVCFNIQSLFRNNPIPWAFRKIWNGFRGNLKWMEGIPSLHTSAKPAFHMLTVAFPLIYSVERMIRQSKGYSTDRGFPGVASGKETACQCGRHKRHWFDPWVGKIWRRKWQPTPVFLPGESPWTEELGGLQSMGCKESDNWAHTHSVEMQFLPSSLTPTK